MYNALTENLYGTVVQYWSVVPTQPARQLAALNASLSLFVVSVFDTYGISEFFLQIYHDISIL